MTFLRVEYRSGGVFFIISLALLAGHFGIIEAAKSDEFFLAVAGKTKEKLVKSGEFVEKSSFGNHTSPELENVFSHTPQMSLSNAGPKTGNARFFPLLPSKEKDISSILFYLFTHQNPSIGHLLRESKSDSFFTSNWHLNEPVKVLVHGYKGSCDRDSFATQLIDAYLSNKNVLNIVCMDWKILADEGSYYDSARHIEPAGQRLGGFLTFLKRSGYIRTYESIHLVGFGLGAHLAGIAGHIVVQKNKDIIGRITGLDPSGPGFLTVPPETRLDFTDATFVDVIHTNMGSLNQGYLGTTAVSGHADFYPNGGSFQPSCGSSIVGDIISTCSHHEAIALFVKTVKGATYIGCRCNHWVSFITGDCGDCRRGPIMGESATKELRTLSCITTLVLIYNVLWRVSLYLHVFYFLNKFYFLSIDRAN